MEPRIAELWSRHGAIVACPTGEAIPEQRAADDRHAFTGGFGVQAAVERALGERFALRLEGGPYTQILRVADGHGARGR